MISPVRHLASHAGTERYHRLAAASAFVVASVAVHNLMAVLVIAVTAVMSFMTRLNPLWIFAAAALLGLTGWL